ncbi:hypothetical protein A4A49_02689 [Nicotiana attenuata]|uniref:Uncharacterized protein n=1 Tax=Nicotiana attenuata TaxID=49451 RepID=A0A1J6HWW2_NICAT|nr:hypothetical protein A4A49_02689 [Nicotiana attenuata]
MFAALEDQDGANEENNQLVVVEDNSPARILADNIPAPKKLNPTAAVFTPKSTGVESTSRRVKEGNVNDKEKAIVEGAQKESTATWVSRTFNENLVATNQSCQEIPSQATEIDATLTLTNVNGNLQLDGRKIWSQQVEEDPEEGPNPSKDIPPDKLNIPAEKQAGGTDLVVEQAEGQIALVQTEIGMEKANLGVSDSIQSCENTDAASASKQIVNATNKSQDKFSAALVSTGIHLKLTESKEHAKLEEKEQKVNRKEEEKTVTLKTFYKIHWHRQGNLSSISAILTGAPTCNTRKANQGRHLSNTSNRRAGQSSQSRGSRPDSAGILSGTKHLHAAATGNQDASIGEGNKKIDNSRTRMSFREENLERDGQNDRSRWTKMDTMSVTTGNEQMRALTGDNTCSMRMIQQMWLNVQVRMRGLLELRCNCKEIMLLKWARKTNETLGWLMRKWVTQIGLFLQLCNWKADGYVCNSYGSLVFIASQWKWATIGPNIADCPGYEGALAEAVQAIIAKNNAAVTGAQFDTPSNVEFDVQADRLDAAVVIGSDVAAVGQTSNDQGKPKDQQVAQVASKPTVANREGQELGKRDVATGILGKGDAIAIDGTSATTRLLIRNDRHVDKAMAPISQSNTTSEQLTPKGREDVTGAVLFNRKLWADQVEHEEEEDYADSVKDDSNNEADQDSYTTNDDTVKGHDKQVLNSSSTLASKRGLSPNSPVFIPTGQQQTSAIILKDLPNTKGNKEALTPAKFLSISKEFSWMMHMWKQTIKHKRRSTLQHTRIQSLLRNSYPQAKQKSQKEQNINLKEEEKTVTLKTFYKIHWHSQGNLSSISAILTRTPTCNTRKAKQGRLLSNTSTLRAGQSLMSLTRCGRQDSAGILSGTNQFQSAAARNQDATIRDVNKRIDNSRTRMSFREEILDKDGRKDRCRWSEMDTMSVMIGINEQMWDITGDNTCSRREIREMWLHVQCTARGFYLTEIERGKNIKQQNLSNVQSHGGQQSANVIKEINRNLVLDNAGQKDGNKDVTKGDNVHVKSKDIPAATIFARMYAATAGALKATADRTDVWNKCDMVQQQVPASGNVKEMQNQQLVNEVAGLPNNETPNRNQSSTAQTGKSKDARQSANSHGHLNLQHTTREKEKEAGVYDSKNQEQVKLTKEEEITHETGAHNNAPGNFVAGVQTVLLEATVMDVDDDTYGGKLTNDAGGTKHTVGDDWKVVRFSGRQGASPGVKNKQQQMSFPDKKDENWIMLSSKTGSPNNTKVQQLEQKQGVVNRSSNKRRSSGVKKQATTPKNIEFSNSFDALSNEQEHVKNKEGKSIQ